MYEIDKTKYVVLTPYMGNRNGAHLACMRELFSQGTHMLDVDGCPYIDMAEALLVESALEKTEAEFFMFIEHDMVFNPLDVEKLISHLAMSDYDALGAIYPVKTFGKKKIVGKPVDSKLTLYVPGLRDAIYLGFGFTAIRRSVFERLALTLPYIECSAVGRKVHPFFMHGISDGRYNPNDISFYERMRNNDMKIGIDCEICVDHIGTHAYRLEDVYLHVPRYSTLSIEIV